MSKSGTVLLLGGGGVTGIAWEIGALVGLAELGFDVTRDADVVIGTSAGAFAGFAAISGNLDASYREQFTAGGAEVPAAMSDEVRESYARAMRENHGDPAAAGRAFGAIAIEARTISQEARAAVVRARLGASDWPTGDFRVTAIDADTGELVLLDRSSGLTLEEAACATGAVPGVWPLVSAGGRRWIDGGMISTANAHLAEGFDRAIILAPVPDSMFGESVDQVVDRLRAGGTGVLALTPDDEAKNSIGPNPFDPTRRSFAAEAGARQGRLHGRAVSKLLGSDARL